MSRTQILKTCLCSLLVFYSSSCKQSTPKEKLLPSYKNNSPDSYIPASRNIKPRKRSFNAIESLLKNKRYLQALPLFVLKVKKHPENPGILRRLGEVYEDAGDYNQALIEFERYHQKFPSQQDPRYHLAITCIKDRKLNLASHILKSLIREHPEILATSYLLSAIYMQEKRYNLEQEVLQNVLQEYPNAIEAQYRLALIYQDQGRYTRAISLLKGLSQKDPLNTIYYNDLGVCEYLNHSESKAISYLKKSIRLDPKSPEAYISLVSIYNHQRNHEESRLTCQKGLQRISSLSGWNLPNQKKLIFHALKNICAKNITYKRGR